MMSRGFTLAELSVVLVIMAFILAAALKGQAVIEAANARSIVSEINEHRTSLNSFYSKYGQFPGDFDDATTYWDPPGDAVTVNGNGNEQIGFKQGSTYEGYRAWEHLSYARMTNGLYAGTETTDVAVLETDVPKSKSGGGYFLDYNVMGHVNYNVLLLGSPGDNSDDTSPTNLVASLEPKLAMSVDSKLDDGSPSTGVIRGDDDGDIAAASACVSSDYYDLSDTTKSCVIGVRLTRFD